MKKALSMFLVLIAVVAVVGCGKSDEEKKSDAERESRISSLEKARSLGVQRMSVVLATKGRQSNPMTELGHFLTYEKESLKGRGTLIDRIAQGYAPSEAHGLVIEAASWKRDGDLLSRPNRWVLYIGQNKRVDLEFYAHKNRKGQMYVPVNSYRESDPFGLRVFYNQKTGILIVDAFATEKAVDKTYFVGQELKEDGTTENKVSTYFDIIVYDNPIHGQLPQTPEEPEAPSPAPAPAPTPAPAA